MSAIAELPECKASEETVGHVDSNFVPNVVRVTPQCDETTFRDQLNLIFYRRGEICGIFVLDGHCFRFLSLVKVDLVEFIHHVLVLRRGEPLLRPVSAIALATLDHVNDMLRRVCVLWAWSVVA